MESKTKSNSLVGRIESREPILKTKLSEIFAPLKDVDESKGTIFLYPREEIDNWNSAARTLSAELDSITGIEVIKVNSNVRQRRFAVTLMFPSNFEALYKVPLHSGFSAKRQRGKKFFCV